MLGASDEGMPAATSGKWRQSYGFWRISKFKGCWRIKVKRLEKHIQQ